MLPGRWFRTPLTVVSIVGAIIFGVVGTRTELDLDIDSFEKANGKIPPHEAGKIRVMMHELPLAEYQTIGVLEALIRTLIREQVGERLKKYSPTIIFFYGVPKRTSAIRKELEQVLHEKGYKHRHGYRTEAGEVVLVASRMVMGPIGSWQLGGQATLTGLSVLGEGGEKKQQAVAILFGTFEHGGMLPRSRWQRVQERIASEVKPKYDKYILFVDHGNNEKYVFANEDPDLLSVFGDKGRMTTLDGTRQNGRITEDVFVSKEMRPLVKGSHLVYVPDTLTFPMLVDLAVACSQSVSTSETGSAVMVEEKTLAALPWDWLPFIILGVVVLLVCIIMLVLMKI